MGKGVDIIVDKAIVLYFIHFGRRDPDLVTCSDCLDYRSGLCPGGADDVLLCMLETARHSEFIGNVSLSDMVRKIKG